MSAQIKICGIRRPQDVDCINKYLPDYAGFIFWEKSFRYVTLQEACRLRGRMDAGIPAVGVFVNETPEKIAQYVHDDAIQIVQLHGQETEEEIQRLRELLPKTPVWKAFKVRSVDDLQRAQASGADRILLDNGYGTGQCFDHSLLREPCEAFRQKPYILAGGLTPENIPEVIAKYHPFMVDISSGVETDKCKDPEKIRRAVQAAHGI